MTDSVYVELLGKWISHARLIKPKPSRLSLRQRAAVALLQVCRDHCMSIFILLKAGEGHATSSALALLRPALESCMRGVWLAKGLEDHRFVREDQIFPPKHLCLSQVREFIHPEIYLSLEAHLNAAKSIYDDFAHGGHSQILRRFNPDGSIGSTYSDDEVRSLVRSAILYDQLASQWIAEEMGDPDVKAAYLALLRNLDFSVLMAS